ncbi:hypothetical protein EB796_000913 [Bugula neritina]|uniref:choline-phosphate cytidylyltransferase n=1 Tax=Bugula neritina TaxID=10212 RepID=A0A7J7KRE6_BUGNE|nr:hypothetical protein EB796_000913 [Bugula neritina]
MDTESSEDCPTSQVMSTKKRKTGQDAAAIPAKAALLCELNTYSEPAPFSDDQKAIESNRQTDYSIKISLEEAKAGTAPRRVRVFADGIYDMFHSGHARQLMQVKQLVPNAYLIVGVCNDALTLENKGRTVMNEKERYEAIRHCRYVDEVLRDTPWKVTDEFLTFHKIDFVAHDDLPYSAAGSEDIYSALKAKGMFLATQRTEGISTTDVIARIIKDYDMYVRRNLSRGYTREDLNVGYLRAKRIEVGGKIDELKEKTSDLIQNWSDRSGEFVQNFMEHFQQNGRIVCILFIF